MPPCHMGASDYSARRKPDEGACRVLRRKPHEGPLSEHGNDVKIREELFTPQKAISSIKAVLRRTEGLLGPTQLRHATESDAGCPPSRCEFERQPIAKRVPLLPEVQRTASNGEALQRQTHPTSSTASAPPQPWVNDAGLPPPAVPCPTQCAETPIAKEQVRRRLHFHQEAFTSEPRAR